VIAGYRVSRLLGQGGMGTVYEAEATGTASARVAIKVLKPEQATRSDAVSRFEREGRVLSAIRHPNICRIFDLGRLADGCPFMVMERLTGETLARRIERDRKVDPPQLVQIVQAALQALHAAHRQNIVHRDFKPDNIFIGTGGAPDAVKVLDFGISKNTGMDDAAAHLTRTGMVMGTPYYMAPEQAMGDRNLDARVDVWAAGVVLYEGLSGRRPFVAKNYNSLLVQILTTSPVPIDQVVGQLPRSLVHAVSRAMEKKRDQRLQSVEELSELLGAVTWPRPVAPSPPARPATSRSDDTHSVRSRRRPSSIDLRPQPAPEDATEEEPTTVISAKADSDDTPLLEDQEATQVDPPRFFDVESTIGKDRGSR